MTRKLTVIIVNYNVRNFTEQCLHSVLNASRNLDVEIMVVDNASQDESISYLEKLFPAIRFLALPANLGFSKANNRALKEASGEHILFLNPDTILSEDVLVNCLQFMAQKKDCGAVGVRMINGEGFFLPESKRMIPTLLGGIRKMANQPDSDNPKKNYYASQIGEYEIAEVEILSGAFMLLSKKAVEASGGFDEDFFMYGEDIDLSYRLLKKGLRNYYLGNNTILHFKGESTLRHSHQFREHFYGAMQIFARKHFARSPMQRLGIVAGSRLAKVLSARQGSKMPPEKAPFEKKENYLVHGEAEAYESIIPFFENQAFTSISFRDLDNHSFSNNSVITFFINKLKPEEVFDWMSRQAGKYRFQFHFAGSHSVVRSKEDGQS